jgi:hypothetical protein
MATHPFDFSAKEVPKKERRVTTSTHPFDFTAEVATSSGGAPVLEQPTVAWDDPRMQEVMQAIDAAGAGRQLPMGMTENRPSERLVRGRTMDDDEQREFTKGALIAASMGVPNPAMAGAGLLQRMAGWGAMGGLVGGLPAFIAGEDLGDVAEEAKTGALWGAGAAAVFRGAGLILSHLHPQVAGMVEKIGNDAAKGKLITVEEVIEARSNTKDLVGKVKDIITDRAMVRAPQAFREMLSDDLERLKEPVAKARESMIELYDRWKRAIEHNGGVALSYSEKMQQAARWATANVTEKGWMSEAYIAYLRKVRRFNNAEIAELAEKGIMNVDDVDAIATAAKMESSWWRGKSNLVADVVLNQWVRGMSDKLRLSPRFGRFGKMAADQLDEWVSNRDLLAAGWEDFLTSVNKIPRARQEVIARALLGHAGGEKIKNLNLTPDERVFLRRFMKFRAHIADQYSNGLPIFGKRPDGRTVIMRPRDDWGLPLYFDEKKVMAFLMDDTPERQRFLKELQRDLKFGTPEAALDWAKKAGLAGDTRWGDTTTGSLFHGRTKLARYVEPDFHLASVLHRYARHAAGGLAAHKLFGPNGASLKALAEQITHADPKVQRKVREEFRALVDAILEQLGTGTSGVKTAATHALALTRFGPHTGAIQLTQLVPSIASHGLVNTLSALMLESRPTFRRMAARAGAHLAVIIDPELGVKNMTRVMKAIGVTHIDRMGRSVAAIASYFNADGLVRKAVELQKAGKFDKLPEIARRLNKLGVNLDDVLRNGGELSEMQVRRIMAEGSNLVNFASRRNDLPSTMYGVGREAGRTQDKTQRAGQELIFTLNSFTTQASNWFEKEIVKEGLMWVQSGGKRGSLMPFIRFAGTLGVSATPVRAAYDILGGRGEESEAVAMLEEFDPEALRDPEYLKELVEESMWNAFETGLIGRYSMFFGDFAPKDPGALMLQAAGPAYSIPLKTGYDIGRGIAEEDPDKVLDTIMRNATWVGRIAHERQKNR